VHHPAGDGQVIAHVRSRGEASTKAVTIINGIVRIMVMMMIFVMVFVMIVRRTAGVVVLVIFMVFVMLVMLVPPRRAQGGADRRPQAEEENECPTEVERHGYAKARRGVGYRVVKRRVSVVVVFLTENAVIEEEEDLFLVALTSRAHFRAAHHSR
jgi:hypothetical protein